MNTATLIFPHQLFKHHPAVVQDRLIILVEEYAFFKRFTMHAHKLVLHRASMQLYADYLHKKGHRVNYLSFADVPTTQALMMWLCENNINEIHSVMIVDNELENLMKKFAQKYAIKIVWYETPMFLTSHQDCLQWADTHKRLLMNTFYIEQRKKHNILIAKNGKPVGGKWSYDKENRKKLPDNVAVPMMPKLYNDEIEFQAVQAAKSYVKEKFPDCYGDTDNFFYAVTHRGAQQALCDFMLNKFNLFGPYQDAVVDDQPFLFHSVISPYLNTGLLTPAHALELLRDFCNEYPVQLSSHEGFVRQLIGWREFMRVVYAAHADVMRKKNFWGHTKKLPRSYWQGSTGIDPIDTVIKRVLRYAYCHHIERLMVLGNWMLLQEFDPDQVYQWFMELFIDSYDWVMVPNVYGMSQFADGGIFATKPYISSSNYILRMSNFKKGDWCEVWDQLFWSFMVKHEAFLVKNPRMKMLITLRKKSKKK